MEPHERLSEAMNRRRLDLRLQWKQVAAGAGISPESLGAIRRGDYRPSELTARGLDDTLHWEGGSVWALLAGGDPTPLPHTKAPADAAQGSGVAFDATARTESAGAVGLSKAYRVGAAEEANQAGSISPRAADDLEGLATGEIITQAELIAEGTEAILKRLGRDLDTRQRRVLSRHAMRLLEDLNEISEASGTKT